MKRGVEDLLIQILWQQPKLAGAACVGRSELFDARDVDNEEPEDVAYRHARAAAVCEQCPVLGQCREFAETEDSKAGHVIAGRIPPPPAVAGRPKKETA